MTLHVASRVDEVVKVLGHRCVVQHGSRRFEVGSSEEFLHIRIAKLCGVSIPWLTSWRVDGARVAYVQLVARKIPAVPGEPHHQGSSIDANRPVLLHTLHESSDWRVGARSPGAPALIIGHRHREIHMLGEGKMVVARGLAVRRDAQVEGQLVRRVGCRERQTQCGHKLSECVTVGAVALDIEVEAIEIKICHHVDLFSDPHGTSCRVGQL
mmetsp:Transcript_33628/g.76128  ORF Transcript_33628/g.76128 Transcript_33628/m.76128 type:complete len:211 (+) Transcript_33628:277-909(+)